jgi:23S rRNA (cytidine1920-2'-O)/16S rRNA (cytidine1409-2'-O)-methyltransferase
MTRRSSTDDRLHAPQQQIRAAPAAEPIKLRIDQLLVERGLAKTRSKAQALIASGRVFSGDVRLEKVGQRVPGDLELRLEAAEEFVSRGGQKLKGALLAFELDVAGRVCVDVGASTGGFTDCLLRAGARKVYAVDVGEAQLDPALAADSRVVVMNRTNARYLEAARFAEPLDLAVVDASFIGIAKLLPALARILPAGALLLVLIKPQFEAGPLSATRGKGVIRDPALRDELISRARACIVAHGFDIRGASDSVLAGPRGNQEHFVLAQRA